MMTPRDLQQVLRFLAGNGFTVSKVRRLSTGEVELVILLPK